LVFRKVSNSRSIVGIEDVLGAIGGAGTLTAWIAREIVPGGSLNWSIVSIGDPALVFFKANERRIQDLKIKNNAHHHNTKLTFR